MTDEQYGFVENVPTEMRSGENNAMVKFPRQEVLQATEVGEQTLTLMGTFGETTFRSLVDLEVFEPGGQGPPNGTPGNGRS